METPTPTSHGKKKVTRLRQDNNGEKSEQEGRNSSREYKVMPAENWWEFMCKDKRRDKKEIKRGWTPGDITTTSG